MKVLFRWKGLSPTHQRSGKTSRGWPKASETSQLLGQVSGTHSFHHQEKWEHWKGIHSIGLEPEIVGHKTVILHLKPPHLTSAPMCQGSLQPLSFSFPISKIGIMRRKAEE